MTVGELKKYLEAFKDEQEVSITTRQAFDISVVPLPAEAVEPAKEEIPVVEAEKVE